MSNILAASTNDNVFTLLAKQNALLGGAGATTFDNEFTLLARNNGLIPGALAGGGGGAAASNSGDLNTLYIKEDFLLLDQATTVNAFLATWFNQGSGATSIVDLKDNAHFGVWKFANTAGLTLNLYNNLFALSSIQKAIMRVVCMPDNSPETGNHEWYAGFYYTPATFPCGALLSQAQGFTGLPLANGGPGNVDCTTGLVAGTYNGTASGGASEMGYLQTGFLPATNQWVDLIVVWTPTQCRYYCAPEGQTPVLKAAINTTIPAGTLAPPAMIQNNSPATNLLVDRIEVCYQFATSYNRFQGNPALITL